MSYVLQAMQAYTFDLKRFISDLGGPTAVHRRLLFMGFDVQLKTVKKWRERGDIALPYLVNLVADRALQVSPLDFNAYIIPSEQIRAPRRAKPPASHEFAAPKASASRG